jgi:hypothetical protein
MKTCLVVGDSRVIRKIARNILEELDFEIVDGCWPPTFIPNCFH